MFYMIQNILELIIGAVVIFSFKPWLFLIVLVGLIPELIVEAKYSRNIWSIDAAKGEIKRRYWNLQYHFKSLSNIIELKLLNLAPNFIGKISGLFRIFRGGEEATERKRFTRSTLAAVASTGAVGIALGWGVNQVLLGMMQIGTLTFLFSTVMDLRQSLSGLFQNLARQYKDSLYLSDTFKFLDLEPVITNTHSPVVLDKNVTPEIKFENVWFGYDKDKPILKNINLTIKAGEKLAIVGVNGAGKTTFIKLLCRFYDPTRGRILLNGKDIREIELASWYELLGALFQDYSRYNFIVSESIAVTVPGKKSSIEKVKEAAKSAEADIFIQEWDNNYGQMLGKEFEGGVEPSSGQWQKLALARTFYRDPKIFILDEPTSSIDAEAEAKIFDKLEALPDDRTVILISHRFSTVRHAHQIIVLEDGTISEQGTHRELVRLEGTYARLLKLQAKGYK